MTTARRLADLPRFWAGAVGARPGSAARTLAKRLVESPVLDISRAEVLMGVTQARAYDAIDRLVDAGILEEITGGNGIESGSCGTSWANSQTSNNGRTSIHPVVPLALRHSRPDSRAACVGL